MIPKLNLSPKALSLFACTLLALACSKNDPTKDETPPVKDGSVIVDPTKKPLDDSSYPNSPEIAEVTDWVTPKSTGPVYYVSAKDGNDGNDAAAAKNPATPWKSIQKAANSIEGGATVIISGGTYKEKVVIPSKASGSPTSQTIFTNKPNEVVLVDGGITDPHASITNDTRFTYQVLIKQANYVTIKGIRVSNVNWYGIASEGTDASATTNNTIENCTVTNSGASGIYVRNGKKMNAIGNKVTKACQVKSRSLKGFGTQECITFASVDGFRISYNEVGESDVSDDAGGEAIDAKGGSSNGEMAKNYVHDILALGLYVDAGSAGSGLPCFDGVTKPAMTNIRVYANKVYRTNGVRIAGELGGTADNIYFYNNIIKESINTGFVFNVPGEKSDDCDFKPWGKERNKSVGKFTNVYVVNNTFYNDGIKPTFKNVIGALVSHNNNPENKNVVIKNNIIYSANTAKFSMSIESLTGFLLSNNLIFNLKPGGVNFAAIKDLDIEGDPLFRNADSNDFSLQPGSAAKGKGVPVLLPGGSPLFTTDFKGTTRDSGAWSIGAFQ